MKNLLFLLLNFLSISTVYSQNFTDLPVWQFTVLFQTDKANIQTQYKTKLDSLANGMVADSAFQVKITAHTDITGSFDENEKLSKLRAETIKNYLIQQGINEKRLAASWKAASEPIADNNTEGGKEQNRRVTIEVFRRIYLAKVTSVVKNDLGAVIPNALVMMRSKYLSDSTHTDSAGVFSIDIPFKQPTIVEVTAKDHFYDKKVLNLGIFKVKLKDFIIAKTEIGKKLNVKDLYFYGNQAVLLPESKPELKILLFFLKINPTYKIELAGHVNAPGFIATVKSFEYTISVDRAKMVYNYLIENGISEKRLVYKGYANWEMLFPDAKTLEEFNANKRVEVRILEK